MKLFTLLFISCLIIIKLSAQPGSLDASFGKNGKAFYTDFGSANAMALQPDGKILIAGAQFSDPSNDFSVSRFMPMELRIILLAKKEQLKHIYPQYLKFLI